MAEIFDTRVGFDAPSVNPISSMQVPVLDFSAINTALQNYNNTRQQDLQDASVRLGKLQESYDDLLGIRIDNERQQSELDRIKRRHGVDESFLDITREQLMNPYTVFNRRMGVSKVMSDPETQRLVKEQLAADNFYETVQSFKNQNPRLYAQAMEDYKDYLNDFDNSVTGFNLNPANYQSLDINELLFETADNMPEETTVDIWENGNYVGVKKVKLKPRERMYRAMQDLMEDPRVVNNMIAMGLDNEQERNQYLQRMADLYSYENEDMVSFQESSDARLRRTQAGRARTNSGSNKNATDAFLKSNYSMGAQRDLGRYADKVGIDVTNLDNMNKIKGVAEMNKDKTEDGYLGEDAYTQIDAYAKDLKHAEMYTIIENLAQNGIINSQGPLALPITEAVDQAIETGQGVDYVLNTLKGQGINVNTKILGQPTDPTLRMIFDLEARKDMTSPDGFGYSTWVPPTPFTPEGTSGGYGVLWRTHGPQISEVFGRDVSEMEFRLSPDMQDAYIRFLIDSEYVPAMKELESEGLANGLTYNQMLAGIHYAGAGGFREYLRTGKFIKRRGSIDGDDTSILEDRLEKVKNTDYSKPLPSFIGNVPTPPADDVIGKYLGFESAQDSINVVSRLTDSVSRDSSVLEAMNDYYESQ